MTTAVEADRHTGQAVPRPRTTSTGTSAAAGCAPAVFGAMDGLVSNLALMTGVAGGDVGSHTHRRDRPGRPGGGRLLDGGRRVHLRRLAARAGRGRAGRRADRAAPQPRGRAARAGRAVRLARGGARARRARWPGSCPPTRSRRWRSTPARSWASTRPTCRRRWSRPASSFVLRSRWARCCPCCRTCWAPPRCGRRWLLALAGLFGCGAAVARVTARSWWYSGLRQLRAGRGGRRGHLPAGRADRLRRRLTGRAAARAAGPRPAAGLPDRPTHGRPRPEPPYAPVAGLSVSPSFQRRRTGHHSGTATGSAAGPRAGIVRTPAATTLA